MKLANYEDCKPSWTLSCLNLRRLWQNTENFVQQMCATCTSCTIITTRNVNFKYTPSREDMKNSRGAWIIMLWNKFSTWRWQVCHFCVHINWGSFYLIIVTRQLTSLIQSLKRIFLECFKERSPSITPCG